MNDSLSVADKVDLITATKSNWIKYQLGESTLQLLEDRLAEPQTHRMRNILIVADTNNGKTTIAEMFLQRHVAEVNLTRQSVVPVVKIECPAADEERLYDRLLNKLPVYSKGLTKRVRVKEQSTYQGMRDCDVRMLVIDEFHNVGRAPAQKQRQFLDVIKTMGNDLMIPIVALGTQEAYNAINHDPQLANRFQPVFLPKWRLNNEARPGEPSEYRRFLVAFEKLLPFGQSSDLGNDPMAERIFALSEGTIGEAADLVRDAAIFAVRKGMGNITENCLTECPYVPPSRRPFAPRV